MLKVQQKKERPGASKPGQKKNRPKKKRGNHVLYPKEPRKSQTGPGETEAAQPAPTTKKNSG